MPLYHLALREMKTEVSLTPHPCPKRTMALRTSPMLHPVILGEAPALPSLVWTHEAKLFQVGVTWLMGKGWSRDIFGVKTPPNPLGHTMEMCGRTTRVVLPSPTRGGW